jgi:hypothetical protein
MEGAGQYEILIFVGIFNAQVHRLRRAVFATTLKLRRTSEVMK